MVVILVNILEILGPRKALFSCIFPQKSIQWCQFRCIFWTLSSQITRMVGNIIILLCHKSKKNSKYYNLSRYWCHGGHFSPTIVQIGCPDFWHILNYQPFHVNMPYFYVYIDAKSKHIWSKESIKFQMTLKLKWTRGQTKSSNPMEIEFLSIGFHIIIYLTFVISKLCGRCWFYKSFCKVSGWKKFLIASGQIRVNKDTRNPRADPSGTQI